MIGPLCFVLAVLASPFKSKLRLEAENAVLRHQLKVVRCRLPGRVRLTNHDRWFFNRRRHRPLRAILPDPLGSAAAIAGQRERVATIKR
jgi:hypothetical protein